MNVINYLLMARMKNLICLFKNYLQQFKICEMKNFVIFLLFISTITFGQLNYTESEVKNKNGTPNEVIDNGKIYVLIYHMKYDYLDKDETVGVGYTFADKYSFTKCTMVTIVHKKKYLNRFYNTFLNNYVKESNNVFIDYENNTKWILEYPEDDTTHFIVHIINL